MKFKNALIRFNVFCSVCMYFDILSWPISTVCENQVYHFLLSEKVKKFCFLPVFVILVLILMGFFSTLKPNFFDFLCDGTKTLVSKWFWVYFLASVQRKNGVLSVLYCNWTFASKFVPCLKYISCWCKKNYFMHIKTSNLLSLKI